MGGLSTSVLLYVIFMLLTFISGTVYWIRRKYRVGAVLSLIFSLLAPLMTVLVAAQRDGSTGVYDYILEEMRAGNTWARLVVIIHIFLIAWILFLIVYLIIKLAKSTVLREKVKKLYSKIFSKKHSIEIETKEHEK